MSLSTPPQPASAPAPVTSPEAAEAPAAAAPPRSERKPEARPDAATGSATPPPFIHVALDPEEYARRFPPSDYRPRSPARAAVRFFAFTLALAAAAGAGAWGALWVGDNGGTEAVLRKLMPLPRSADTPADLAAAPAPVDPPNGDGAAQAPLRTAQELETPVVREEPSAPRPAAKVRSNPAQQDAAVDSDRAQQGAVAKEQAVETSSGGTGNESSSDSDAADAAAEAPPKRPAPKATKSADKVAADKSAAEQQAKAKSAKKSSSSAQKIARGREINRIQQQAADELKKKTKKRRPAVEQARKTTKSSLYASSGPQRVHRLLARCEKLDGLFWREKCKWRICDGRWGKDGCPAYTRGKLAYD